jgi:hypothetical protein
LELVQQWVPWLGRKLVQLVVHGVLLLVPALDWLPHFSNF